MKVAKPSWSTAIARTMYCFAAAPYFSISIPRPPSEKGEADAEKEAGYVDPAKKPNVEPSESGDEQAAERPPVPRDPKVEATPGDSNEEDEKSESGDDAADDSESDDAETGDLRSVVD